MARATAQLLDRGGGAHGQEKPGGRLLGTKAQTGQSELTEGGDITAGVSFNKPASAVSCCSGPLMLTHMPTQGKNLHGTRP